MHSHTSAYNSHRPVLMQKTYSIMRKVPPLGMTYKRTLCVHMPFLFSWHNSETCIDYFKSRLHNGIQKQIFCDIAQMPYQFEIMASTMLIHTHLKMICCLITIQSVISVYGYSGYREPACLVGKEDRQEEGLLQKRH